MMLRRLFEYGFLVSFGTAALCTILGLYASDFSINDLPDWALYPLTIGMPTALACLLARTLVILQPSNPRAEREAKARLAARRAAAAQQPGGEEQPR